MYEAIKKTAQQFAFKPKIINGNGLEKYAKYVVAGMGGSYLAVGLLKLWKPELDIVSHRDYGLPELPTMELKKRLIILSSYSGNTEEVLSAYEKAGKLGLKRVVISVGGKLLEMAKKDKTAYIQMPDLGIQPRSALPLSLLSFVKITGDEKMLKELNVMQDSFHPDDFEAKGKELAKKISGRVPIIYTSNQNEILGYIGKITFNETGKIPAFNNVFPELNHNEINGIEKLTDKFYFLFLMDSDDSLKIKKRMEITAKMYKDRKLMVETLELEGKNKFLRVFNPMALINFAAYFTAEDYGLEAEQVPMVEELKKKI